MAYDVVILGAFMADTAHRAERMPRMGETIEGKSFMLGPGGKGSNQAVAAARAGANVAFLTKLGQDAFADMALKLWAEAGVASLALQTAEHPTGSAFIFLDDATGDNAIIISPGSAGTISPADVEARAAEIAQAEVFVTQLEQPLEAAERGLGIARAGGAMTILNPAPAATIPDEMLALCDFVTPNETEASALSGITVTDPKSAADAAKAILGRGAGGGPEVRECDGGDIGHAQGRGGIDAVPARDRGAARPHVTAQYSRGENCRKTRVFPHGFLEKSAPSARQPAQRLANSGQRVRPDTRLELPFMLRRRAGQVGEGGPSRRPQRQDLDPPVPRTFPAFEDPLALPRRHRARHLRLVDARAPRNLPRRHRPVAAKVEQHPPFRAQHAVAILVDLGKPQRLRLGRRVQQVGREVAQLELRIGGHGALRLPDLLVTKVTIEITCRKRVRLEGRPR